MKNVKTQTNTVDCVTHTTTVNIIRTIYYRYKNDLCNILIIFLNTRSSYYRRLFYRILFIL